LEILFSRGGYDYDDEGRVSEDDDDPVGTGCLNPLAPPFIPSQGRGAEDRDVRLTSGGPGRTTAPDVGAVHVCSFLAEQIGTLVEEGRGGAVRRAESSLFHELGCRVGDLVRSMASRWPEAPPWRGPLLVGLEWPVRHRLIFGCILEDLLGDEAGGDHTFSRSAFWFMKFVMSCNEQWTREMVTDFIQGRAGGFAGDFRYILAW